MRQDRTDYHLVALSFEATCNKSLAKGESKKINGVLDLWTRHFDPLYGSIRAMHSDVNLKQSRAFDLLSENRTDGLLLHLQDHVPARVWWCTRTRDHRHIDKRTRNYRGKWG